MLDKLVINVSAAKDIFCDFYREAAAKLLYAIEHDAYVLAGVENIHVTQFGGDRATEEFPNVISLLDDAMHSKVSRMVTAYEDGHMFRVFTETELQEIVKKKAFAYYRMIQVSNNIFLWQHIGENGVTTLPRLFEEGIDSHGKNVFHELLPVKLLLTDKHGAKVGELLTCVSQFDILTMYGVSNPQEYLLDDSNLEFLNNWISSLGDAFERLDHSKQEEMINSVGEFVKTKDFRKVMINALAHVWSKPIRNVVEYYYGIQSDMKDNSVGPILVTLEVENKLQRFGEAAAVLERPRYVGWFKTLQDAVNFVVFEIENNPTYKDKEEVIRDMLPNGDIVMTINSTLQLTYHFEKVQV